MGVLVILKIIGVYVAIIAIVKIVFWLKEEWWLYKFRKHWECTPENMKRRGYTEDGSRYSDPERQKAFDNEFKKAENDVRK